MTDRNERDALVAQCREMADKLEGDGTTLTDLFRQAAEALAAPAEGGLIDSAGGAKGHDLWKAGDAGIPAVVTDRNGDVTLGLCKVCGQAEADLQPTCPGTPQPAEGDGAVADALMVVNDAANAARHAGDYAKANALVRARVTLYQAIARPAATAQPEQRSASSILDGAIAFIEEIAAPAAPKGGVVDALCREARELQRKNYGSGAGLHLDMIDWARKYDAALATGEQP